MHGQKLQLITDLVVMSVLSVIMRMSPVAVVICSEGARGVAGTVPTAVARPWWGQAPVIPEAVTRSLITRHHYCGLWFLSHVNWKLHH